MEPMNWHDIILLVIAGLVALFGSPIIQLIKNFLSWVIKKPIKEGWAFLVATILAGGLSVLEMFLTGQLKEFQITLSTFPEFFAVVFLMAQGYFAIFKNTTSNLGQKLLLRKYTP